MKVLLLHDRNRTIALDQIFRYLRGANRIANPVVLSHEIKALHPSYELASVNQNPELCVQGVMRHQC